MSIHVISALWKREVIKFIRDPNRVVGALLQPLVFWLLLGFGFQDTFQLPEPGSMHVPYLEFLFPGMLTLVALFTALFSTLSIVEERKAGFLQAALSAPVPRSSPILGIVLGGTTLAVVHGLPFLILIPIAGPIPSLLGFGLMVVILSAIGIAFTSLGIILALRTRTTRGFHSVMSLLMIPLWVLSGAFFPGEGAPSMLQWAIRINPVSYGIDALRTTMYLPGDVPAASSPLGVSLAITGLFAICTFGLAVYVVHNPAGNPD